MLAQIHESDIQLEKAIESYNYANVQLGQIDADLNSNAHHLVVAQKSLKAAQAHIAERLRALYVNGDQGGAVEILLGAENLDDLLGRLDMVQRVGDQDAKVLAEVKAFRKEVKERRARLTTARRIRPGSWPSVPRLEAVDRGPALAAPADARRHPERDQAAAGRGSAPAGAAAEARPRHGWQHSSGQPRRLAPRQPSSRPAASPPRSTRTPSDSLIPAAPPAQYGGVVGIAMQELGKPYVWGAAGPSSFDCSGLAMYVYAQVGVSLPHNAAAMFSYGSPVGYGDLQPGDLVFFSGLGHMGIYIGGGQFIHAPHTGDVVKISNMSDPRWLRGRPPHLGSAGPRPGRDRGVRTRRTADRPSRRSAPSRCAASA